MLTVAMHGLDSLHCLRRLRCLDDHGVVTFDLFRVVDALARDLAVHQNWQGFVPVHHARRCVTHAAKVSASAKSTVPEADRQ